MPTSHPSHDAAGTTRVWTIVPAAGRSRRMGQPKALLPFGESTIVETVLVNLRNGGATRIVVVVNPTIDGAVRSRVGDAADVVVNPRADSEMIESIRIALAHVETAATPRPHDGCLVLPVDQPQVDANSVGRCLEAFRNAPDRIVVASRGPRRGHPILFPWALVEDVRALPPNVGLNALPRRHPERVLDVPCDDESVITDIDTPEDYDRVRRG